MFVTVKALTQRIDNQISCMNVNMDMLEGKLDNPNNYSRDYILDFISKQCNDLHDMINALEFSSENTKLIVQYKAKAQEVINRFSIYRR